MSSSSIVYIDRLYDDGWTLSDRPWPRRRREQWESEWMAVCDSIDHAEENGFDTVEDAIAWGCERSDIVLVRLGTTMEAMYSAGSRPATERVDGTGWRFPSWPPASWPNYTGPPDPG